MVAFLDRNFISHLNWSVADKLESSAALFHGASPDGGWTLSQIKPSGRLVRGELLAKAPSFPLAQPPITQGRVK